MNKKEKLKRFQDENEVLNIDREIKRGDIVNDGDGVHGVVVEVTIPENLSIEDHGSITIWLDKKYNYGSNNCEHYTYWNWKTYLRIEESYFN